ncbi:FG-GAP repeat domain-containing protein [Phytohabitans aurantiacus]|nr:VCBS repeat-containing protein [Phytohabitans aurantiacus]
MSGHYEPLETITTGSWPENVAIGDVTGDGRNDVLLTTSYYFDEENDYKLFVYSQRPDGSLRPEVKYQTRMAYGDAGGLAVLDTNGDGRLDVAVATSSGVEIFAQSVAGTLESRGVLAGSPVNASQVTAADLDADADADLLVAGRAGIAQLTQGDGGTFTRSPVTTENTTVVRVGDLDSDGRLDAVGFRGYYVTVYRNLGDYWRREVPLVRDVSVNSVEVADVTADGRADLLVTEGGNRPSSQLVVFPQTDTGTLAKPTTYPVMDIPQPVRAADIDGDGRNDVVTVHGGWERVSTLLQRADGTLAPAGLDEVPYATNYNDDGLAVGDVNGDGRTDVVIADYNHGVVILRNAG